MSKTLNRVCVCGHFAFGKDYLNGQTIKTKIVTAALEHEFGKNEILKTDTHGGKGKLLSLPLVLFDKLKKCKNIIILPAQNGLRIIAPLLAFENTFFHRKLHYVVIGGWLSEFLENKPILTKTLKRFDYIYVETQTMKSNLNLKGFDNVKVMPNCKELKILDESELVYSEKEPYKLCTFSRVMKEKGIEDAVKAVKAVNNKYGKIVFSLDIYGQVDKNQTEWFETLKATFPPYINYGGVIPFDKSADLLKDYYALLFPTYYNGEGFAGTLIDAMAAGVPVIASDWKYNSELVDDGETGVLYSVNDKEELIEKIVYCYEERKAWNNMKRNCLCKAGEFTPEKVISILINKL